VILKNDKKDRICIMTTNGALTIRRTILRPNDDVSMARLLETEDVKCIAPMDIVLRIADLPFKVTREMMCEVAFWGQNQSSYKAASSVIKKVYGVSISSETVRAITDCVGKIVFDEDRKEAEETYKNAARINRGKVKEGVLYIQADGAALNTRTKNNEGSTWRENKLGVVFSSDNVKRTVNKKGGTESDILKKEYTSYVGSCIQFKMHLFACAIRNGYGQYKETVLLSDGASWIKNIADELFPDAVLILDLFHLCENTYNYAKAIFGSDETKYRPWAEYLVKLFKDGRKDEAIQILEAFKERKIPKGTVNLYNYVLSNFDRIDYKEYAEKGYYVGSGVIESGNKVVLQKRLKLAGMRWDESSAQNLLSLRSKYESELWCQSVVDKVLYYDFEHKCIS